MPLLSFSSDHRLPHPSARQNRSSDDDSSDNGSEGPQKGWMRYCPLFALVVMMFAPHGSLLLVLVNHYLRTLHAPITFLIHLSASYTLTFLSFSSLMVCVVRDPGPVSLEKSCGAEEDADEERDELGLSEALMSAPGEDDDFDFDFDVSPAKWCRKCWAPKPERTHHCSLCGRCVLKMVHFLSFAQTITARG
ncbi:hypothetical protein ID866_8513 [Astraeus odoratus]|nr:hypothetical protein ID866_8513 [Astraeus odoratus]